MSTTLSRSIAAALASIMALTAFTACDEKPSSSDSDSQSQEAPKSEESTKAESSEPQTTDAPKESASDKESSSEKESSSAPESSAEAPKGDAKGTEVKIGKTFNDTAVGDKIEIVSVRRNVASEKRKATIQNGGEVLWLQIKFTPSGKYTGLLTSSDFAIRGANGNAITGRTTLNDEIKAAGLKPFDNVSRKNGPTTVWLGFDISKKASTYKAAYLRGEAKIIGKNTTLPKFTGEFEIPAA